MKRATGLFELLLDEDHLQRALSRVVRGRRTSPEAAWLLFRRHTALRELRDALAAGTWRHAPFRLLYLTQPKPRVIALAGLQDRWVQAALALALAPQVLRTAEACSYGGRPGGGTQRAALALLRGMRAHRFVLHLDVRSFFPSVDPERVRALLRQRVADRAFLEVLDQVLERGRGLFDLPSARKHARIDPHWPPPGRGLPLGAATSQLLAAHLYLEGLDRFVKRTLRVPQFVRYVDDLFLFGNRRADLRAWRSAVGDWLAAERDLRLKRPEARVLSCAGRLHALGRVIDRTSVTASERSWRRAEGLVGRVLRRAGDSEAEGCDRAALVGSFGGLFWP